MKMNIKYILVFGVLLIAEVMIGLFVKDTIIRPYIGDILVVILMYTFIRGIARKTIKFLPLYLFAFASAVELAQYYHIVDILHLQGNKVISIMIGSSFDIKDILCYLIGAFIIVVWERIEKYSNKR